jgi:hypothetical protein
MSWLVGDYWWCGDICLRCVAIVHGSHRCLEVAHIESERDGYLTWTCPECGATVGQADPPSLRQSPLCHRCECAHDPIPPTLRDPGLPPAAPGIRDAAAGAPDSRE